MMLKVLAILSMEVITIKLKDKETLSMVMVLEDRFLEPHHHLEVIHMEAKAVTK